MAYYLSKYVGQYRLKTAIDIDTHDFCRNVTNDQLSQYNVYIKCNSGIQITHYGHNVLTCYIPSLGRGRNILKNIAQSLGLDIKIYDLSLFDYESLYRDLIETKMFSYISETDEEVIFRFKDKDLSFMFEFVTPQTSGASISPFSPKNLQKKKYEISIDNLQEYKEILGLLNKEDKLVTGRITTQFITEYIPKKHKEYRNKNMNSVMRKEQLKGKEFIHSIGLWDEYIEYLKTELKNRGVLNA